jgi:hypothetical protein
MKAFLDESGTHANSRVTAMVGYVIEDEALPLLEKGETGKRLDELPRDLLPPDDPEWFRSRGVELGLDEPEV